MKLTRAACAALLALMTVLLSGAGAQAAQTAGTIEQVTGFGTNPGALKMYRYIPEGLPQGAPVVVVLHGCSQNATTFGTQSGWTQLADRWKFSVVLPEQVSTNHAGLCFNWYETADMARGQGEPASIKQMTDRQIADTGADRSRVYVTGLSAGGGMTSVMMATYPDVYKAGGIVAGLPYGCSQAAGNMPYMCMFQGAPQTPEQWGNRVRAAYPGYNGPWPTLSVYHGTADWTVRPVNMSDLVEQWTNVHGTDQAADLSDTVAGYPHQVYRNGSGAAVVETYSITSMGHGQPVDPGTGTTRCGTAGAYVLDTNICAAHRMGQTWGLG
ncbi:PHB depolymerase family esterase [Streptomyces sp. M2CJ-2]|uniref:extracellular catalytic domain type 1 short-chain-length polyhydroxyalkanoate depolymerase n=1 Tax=Streptomyces sp. M2CJ-2 TaxID=2803948 RepID=UPI001929114B|nr:PHB depolymerase family esterase [Streptomyces sp. M2CJ-2]MBL3671587.1 PHB depolymerase family esterase [Streptomyces sp. M2CJ-2]